MEDTRLQEGEMQKNAMEPVSRQMSKISVIISLIALSLIV